MNIKIKYIILFTIFCNLSVCAQQYRLNLRGSISGRSTPELIKNGTISVYIDGTLHRRFAESFQFLSINNNSTINSFTNFSMNEISSTAPGDVSPTCTSNDTDNNNTISDLLLGSANVSGCSANLTAKIKPIITSVQRLNGTGSELCIGGQLSLGAFPAGFPNIAYNWQYSTNGTQWFNFPAGFNQVSQNNFTMEEIIGANHTNFIGSNIRIRLGRGSTGAGNYSSTFTVNYSACAPLVTGLNYSPPNCTNDAIILTTSFSRPLDTDTNEIFSQISIVDTMDSALIFEQQFDEIMDTTTGNTYTFNTVFGLEEGHRYLIKYQMKKNGVLVPGFIESVQTFVYNDATPVTFTATLANNVECFGNSTGEINITANGGSGKYSYLLNNSRRWIRFSMSNTHLVTNLVSGNYTVKVKDSNNCIAQQ